MTQSPLPADPSVSILLPTHSERPFIRDCLASIQRQTYSNIVEVLVIDGGSEDGTRAIATSLGPPFRLVDNPGVTAAAAMNVGVREATGDVVVRMDAHAHYARDYVERCVAVLTETGADNVGGRMNPIGLSSFGRAVAAVTSTPACVGPGSFHHAADRTDVDTVFLGCWRRETLEQLGGFDEAHLQWAAEDHECNLRLTESGGRIVLDPSIQSTYFPRDTPRGLARQYHNYGIGKVSTLRKHHRLPTWRSVPPAALVLLAAANLGLGAGILRFTVPAGHAVAVSWSSRSAVKRAEHDTDLLRCILATEIMHWSFGLGFWRGVGRVLTGRGFVSNPRGHR